LTGPRRTPGSLAATYASLRASGRDHETALASIYELGQADVGRSPARRIASARRDSYVARVRTTAAPILAAVAERNDTTVAALVLPGGDPVARREAMHALHLAGLGFRGIALVMGCERHWSAQAVLKRFRPTAEQSRALAAIAGVEAVKPKLSAVA
jgi:hypothetical protein